MLLIASELLRRNPILVDVARELSLNISYFRDTAKFAKLLGGQARRFVMLTETDLTDSILACLEGARGNARFGMIVVGDRDALRSSDKAELVERIAEHENTEWLMPQYGIDELSTAARTCRRRMLTLSKDELEQALVKREFFIQYQPKVERSETAEWRTREAEALIRWHHPHHGLLGPLEFLPEAEAFDMIGPISELVLYEAAAQLVTWEKTGLCLNSCINLASSQLNNTGLPKSYAQIVEQHGLECSRFTFEVTEQDVANSEAPHLKVLNELRSRGFRISLDDFGVATSSLGTFEQLPFDEIKIHAKALQRARNNPVALKILAAVTGLAHKLGISVCAEGVEDQETFEFLNTIECDKMQGFLISEAVMPDIIRRVYSARQTENVA